MPKNMPERHLEADAKKLVCGSCKWFRSGYKGITCQKTREVELETPACVEYVTITNDPFMVFARDKYLLDIRKEIRDNSRIELYKKFRTEVSGYLLDIDGLNLALGSHQSSVALQEALKKIVSYRYRVSEIYTSMSEFKADIEAMSEKVYVWLVSNYEEIRDLKNEKLRHMAVQRSVPELVELTHEINKTVDIAKYIDGKLDKNDSTIQAMLRSVNSTHFAPTRNINANQ